MSAENLTKPRIKVPDAIRAGDVIEVRAVVTHVMETGNRRDSEGKPIPRNVVNTIVARFRGDVVFTARTGPGISANPFIQFPLRVAGAGTLEVSWTDDENRTVSESMLLDVVQ